MEAEWLRQVFHSDTLKIESPEGFHHLPSQDPHSWKPFGYRQYRKIIVQHIERLYLDEMLLFFQMANTAMQYDGSLMEVIITETPAYGYKTWPDQSRVAFKMGEAGFRVTEEAGRLIGHKD